MLKRFGLGFAVGYVLGARAGQERYEQITSAGQKLADLPAVRGILDKGPDNLKESGGRLLSSVKERVSSLGNVAGEPDEDDVDDEADEADDRGSDEGEDEPADEEGESKGSPAERRSLTSSLAGIASAAFERGKVA